jgi:hypothetical protein
MRPCIAARRASIPTATVGKYGETLDRLRSDNGEGNGRYRTRTCDPLIKSQLLYQLS